MGAMLRRPARSAAAPTLALTLSLGLASLLAGCPDEPVPPPPTNPGQGGAGQVEGSTPGGGEGAKPGEDPLAGSVFSKDELFEIYAAELAGGEAREAALREHRLIDAQGREVPARARAYERALQQYAQGDPAGWSAFLEGLPR